MGRLVYIALGFAVGYLIDVMKQRQLDADSDAPKMEEIRVTTPESVSDAVASAPASADAAEVVEATKVTTVAEEDSPAFLKKIDGIGPTYAKRIFESGIRSLAHLAACDPAELATISKVRNPAKAAEWIKEAKTLL